MGPKLHQNWQNILKYAWSVRLMALSGVLSGTVAGLTVAQPYLSLNPILIAVVIGVLTTAAAIISILGIYARIVKQQGVP